MLVRDTTLASPEKILSDNLTHKPSTSQSVWENFTSGIATPFNAVRSFDEEYSKSPAGQDVFGLLETIKRGNENPEVGWGQWTANEASNLIGQALSPPNWALGGVGARLMRPVSTLAAKVAPEALTTLFRTPLNKIMASPIAKYLPSVVGKKGEEQTLSMGLLGHKVAQGFGIGAAMSLPQETLNNFNAETGKHDFLGIAKGMGVNGMFGMALSPIPVAWGVLRANINRARGLPSGFHVEPGEAEPHISPEEHETWQAVDNHARNPESRAEGREKATAAATQYLAKRGFSVNEADNTVNLEIMTREHIDNLQAASVDQLLSDYVPEEYQNALSDFTINSAVDDMSKNAEIFDGVRGYVDYIDKNMEKKGEVLAKADALVDQHLDMVKPDERLSLDQESLSKVYHNHAEGNHLPFTVPKNVAKRVAQEKKIQALEEKNERLFRQYEESGSQSYLDDMKANNEKINALHENLEPLQSARQELESLRKSLISEKGLKRGYEHTPDFHRLEELADIWEPAHSLLDRIRLERELREQQAYRDLAKTMLDIADGNLGKLANVDKVKSYLEARQAPQINTGNKPATMESVKKSSKVPSDADTIIAEQDRAVEEKGGKDAQHDYETAKDKFEEFKKSEGIFKNFISCVLGGQNG